MNSPSTICSKCRYQRKPSDTNPEWQCPNCGVAYVKVTAGASGQTRPSVSDGQENSAKGRRHGGVELLCKQFNIWKSWALKTPDMSGVVLVSPDAIYLARRGTFGAPGFGPGAGFVKFLHLALNTFVTKPQLEEAPTALLSELPPNVQAHPALERCSEEVFVIPRKAVREINSSIWSGTTIISGAYTYKLCIGLFGFSKARELLIRHRWLGVATR